MACPPSLPRLKARWVRSPERIRRLARVSTPLGYTSGAERGRVRHTPTESLTAYDALLRGDSYYWRTTKDANAQARQLFERAIARDPDYAAAYTRLAETYWADWNLQWNQDPQNLERALDLAQKALALDDSLPEAHGLLGLLYLYGKRDFERAVAEGERAVALAPNCGSCYATLGLILNFAGRPQETPGRSAPGSRGRACQGIAGCDG
jgi:adenylate cyclase